MAGIDVGASGGGRRRATNSDLNMIPFIDLLMCTIAFLLITAVWVTGAQLSTVAEVGPSRGDGPIMASPRALHVSVRADDFLLQWRQAGTVLNEVVVPRSEASEGEGPMRLPVLARVIGEQWTERHQHGDEADYTRDLLVLHSGDHARFRDLVAVMDAANSAKRSMRKRDGALVSTSAFQTTLASN